MKLFSQFFPLVRIELRCMPGLWLFLSSLFFLCGVGIYIRYWVGMDADLLLADHTFGIETIFTFLIIVYAGSFLFPNESKILQVGESSESIANPPEFMLTRAIDRKTYFQAKVAIFLAMVLLPVVILGAFAYLEPDLKLATRHAEISERGKIFLSHFPNVRTEPGDGEFRLFYIVPGGRAVYTGWKFWSCTFFALFVLGWMSWILRVSRNVRPYMLFLTILAIAPFLVFAFFGNLFFNLYLAHQGITITTILLIGFSIYFLSEKNFKRSEVP